MVNQQPLDRNLFNIDILILSPVQLANLREVTKLNVFDPNTQVFDNDGLFSTTTFGPLGSTVRNEKPGYIDLKLGILHPLVYLHIISLKSNYENIIIGKEYAKFDSELGDFIPAKNEDGETGYSFFLRYIDKLKLDDNDSDQRRYKIELIKKYGNTKSLIDKWLVLPAGLRDYTVDDSGQPSEDEVNTLYRKMLATAGMIKNTKVDTNNIKLLDPMRIKMQMISVEIYNHFIKNTMDGKNKFIQGKWAKRAIMLGTRNVITPAPVQITDLTTDNKISFNDTVLGVYQFIQAIAPVTMNRIHNLFINKIFNPESETAVLVEPTNLETIMVNIPVKKRDEWLSLEGLSGIISKLAQDDIKTDPIMVDKYYLLLVYDDGKNIKIIFNSSEITEEMNKKYIRPITYIEFMYIAIYDVRRDFPAFLTRYPVAGLGGIYPTDLYVKTTVKGRTVELTLNGVTKEVFEYPILTEEFVNSISPHVTKLQRLGADLKF